MAARLAYRDNVLVHCRHGVVRTGAFVTLLLALLLMSMESLESLESVVSATWRRCLQAAVMFYEERCEMHRWETWPTVLSYWGDISGTTWRP